MLKKNDATTWIVDDDWIGEGQTQRSMKESWNSCDNSAKFFRFILKVISLCKPTKIQKKIHFLFICSVNVGFCTCYLCFVFFFVMQRTVTLQLIVMFFENIIIIIMFRDWLKVKNTKHMKYVKTPAVST